MLAKKRYFPDGQVDYAFLKEIALEARSVVATITLGSAMCNPYNNGGNQIDRFLRGSNKTLVLMMLLAK